MERIKILFFIEELCAGGAEKVLCNLVNAMDQSKFDITVQTLWKAEAGQYLKPGIRYRYCYASHNKMNNWRSRLEAELGLTYPLHIKDDYDIEVAYLEFGPTKILSHSTNRKAKKIAWVHSDMERKLSGKPDTKKKLAGQYATFDRIVCVSHTARDSFVRLFGHEGDTYVLYNIVDGDAIREKALLCPDDMPPKRRLTITAVGRLSEEKQYDMLLHVHKRLLDAGVLHDLWIIGDGNQRDRLERIVSEEQISDSATLFGFRSNPYPYMNEADLLVCSSRYEGLSTFVTEGLILGKPIVTTECSGMRELLGDSEYGLITENAEEALLAGMRQMLTDPVLRSDYASWAEARGRDFTAQSLTEETERCLIALAGGNHEG